MAKHTIDKAIADMQPFEAARALVEALRKLFPVIQEKDKLDLVMELFGESPSDKIGSMVHR